MCPGSLCRGCLDGSTAPVLGSAAGGLSPETLRDVGVCKMAALLTQQWGFETPVQGHEMAGAGLKEVGHSGRTERARHCPIPWPCP